MITAHSSQLTLLIYPLPRNSGYGPKRFPKNPCLRAPRTRTSSTTTARRASSHITYAYAPRAPTRRAHELNYKTVATYHDGSACRTHRYFFKTVDAYHNGSACRTHRYSFKTVDAYHEGSACRKHRYPFKTVATYHDGSACRTHRYFYKTVATYHDGSACSTHRYNRKSVDLNMLCSHALRHVAGISVDLTRYRRRQQAQLLPALHPMFNTDTVTCPAEASSMDPCSV